MSSFNLCPPCFLTITVPFTSLRDENFFRLSITIIPAQLKSFKPYHLLHGKGPTVHTAHINCALCSTECSWCLVKCSWKRRRRRRSGGVEENTACGKSLPASQRSPTLTSELHSTHRLSAAHCTQRSLLRLIF